VKAAASKAGKLAVSILSVGAGFLLADGIDRFLATYNPAGQEQPKNKFTSDGAGTLANALNVASPPHLHRIGAAVAAVVVPVAASMYVKNSMAKRTLEAMALGAGVNGLKLLVTNVLLPMLAPKGEKATQDALQKSHIARLYPAEVAAKINLETQTEAVSSSGSGALSDPPDVGPFALAGSSPYPDAEQALRRQAGLDGDSSYPSASQALREATGVLRDGLKDGTGLGYRPPPPRVGRPASPAVDRWRNAHPGYRAGGHALAAGWSQRWGNTYNAGGVPATHHHHHCMLRAKAMYPTYTDQQLHAWCVAHPYNTHPYLYEPPAPAAPVITATPAMTSALGDPPDAGGAPPDAGPPPAAPPPAAPMGPPVYAPGPGSSPGPGPHVGKKHEDCGCGDTNPFLGFVGDEEEKDVLIRTN
jgi:hypothetical protein